MRGEEEKIEIKGGTEEEPTVEVVVVVLVVVEIVGVSIKIKRGLCQKKNKSNNNICSIVSIINQSSSMNIRKIGTCIPCISSN